MLWRLAVVMDEVKLAVQSSKFMGSEGFGSGGGGGGLGVTVTEVEARESDRISILVASSIGRYSSALSKKAEMCDVNTSQSSFWDKMADTELCSRSNQISSFSSEEAPEELKFRSRNNSTFSMPSLEGKQVQRKSGKVARSSSGCSKRSRVAQMKEVSINEAEADDIKEKSQIAKQRNTVNGKRGDKRNGKVAMKGKYDYLSLKAGMVGFNSGAGGNNFLGAYGLKSDTSDVTKHLDELSVNELLDGSYKGPSFAKDKGKKAANLNEMVVQSVRNALSILRLHKPLHNQNSSEIDNSCNRKVSTCPVSSDTSVASRNAGDKGDTSTVHPSSYDKVQDSLSKNETPAKVLDLELRQPKDILERLALPSPKDLDSLLLDAAKATVLLKNNNSDSRGKQVSQRASLSPFPWSHNSGGHCKASADAIKLSVSRTTCQGRWVKIGDTSTSPEGGSGFLADLELLTKDNNLVALKGPKCGPSESEIAPATSVSFPWIELGSSSSAAPSIASQLPPESSSNLKCEIDAGHSPRLLAAAQTLYDISSHSLKQHGMIRWPKKPLEKTMKACKSKSGKPGEIFAARKPVIATDDRVKNTDEVSLFKKPRLLNKDLGPNTVSKAPINWSMQRSSGPSPDKSFRDPIVETKQYNNAHVVKQSGLMPPPPVRVSDKACNSRQKLRKLLPGEWNREGGR
ncbi:hypothetical protein RHGRI_019970 [Rhododendron griersonianum]|uniref:Uncharacterized protein n=1 Tax=Rhododendron griersonianum TaxID=479676 RepID=A0AAV6JER2_9ERIC|nr:hypothetical protein RHGRI_019970 [Rhododendron griersonianum]